MQITDLTLCDIMEYKHDEVGNGDDDDDDDDDDDETKTALRIFVKVENSKDFKNENG